MLVRGEGDTQDTMSHAKFAICSLEKIIPPISSKDLLCRLFIRQIYEMTSHPLAEKWCTKDQNNSFKRKVLIRIKKRGRWSRLKAGNV